MSSFSEEEEEADHDDSNGENGLSLTSDVFVAVHSGAGNHSKAGEEHHKNVCKTACQQAIELLGANCSAMDAVTTAVASLEDDESTNAGYGSNLTFQGNVECEASVMDGKSLFFGAVGALSGVKNPVKVANILVKEQMEGPLPFGRIRPSVLTGKGAKMFCTDHGIAVNHNLISKSAFKTHNRYKKKCQMADLQMHQAAEAKRRKVDPCIVEHYTPPRKKRVPADCRNTHTDTPPEDFVQDTVGAICVDRQGNMAAASSSGGIWLKHAGRLGPVAMHGAGCWAQNPKGDKEGVGVVASGCGEQMMQTLLAKTVADGLRESENLTHSLPVVFTNDFLNSEYLPATNEKMGGALAVKLSDTSDGREVELGWIHSTASFCFAFMGGRYRKSPKGVMSYLGEKSIPGRHFTMGGHLFCL